MKEKITPKMSHKEILKKVKKSILSLGKELQDLEAIGICGSLARGVDFNSRSDIDIFIVIKEKVKENIELYWYKRLKSVLKTFNREITVLVYSIKGLKMISNWYVLRLASEGILIYDKANIGELFNKIIAKAKSEGMVEQTLHGVKFWSLNKERIGKPLSLSLE